MALGFTSKNLIPQNKKYWQQHSKMYLDRISPSPNLKNSTQKTLQKPSINGKIIKMVYWRWGEQILPVLHIKHLKINGKIHKNGVLMDGGGGGS
jgi:hypothetical protein